MSDMEKRRLFIPAQAEILAPQKGGSLTRKMS